MAYEVHDIGYFGNIWIRENHFTHKGDSNLGHYHKFDHVTLLVKGSVEIEIDGAKPKVFTAPTFIVIAKDKRHKLTALEDNVTWYCVYALRDLDGEVTNIFSGDRSPYGIATPNYEEMAQTFDVRTTHHD